MNIWAIIWLALIVVFIIMEAATVQLISTWFAVGALAAMIAGLLGGAVWLQVTLFLLVSGILLASLRPLARKHFTPKLTRTNVDSVIGSTGLVTVAIDNVAAAGQVKLGAMDWTARSTSGEPIPVGTRIRVDQVEGVKVYVTAVEVAARP